MREWERRATSRAPATEGSHMANLLQFGDGLVTLEHLEGVSVVTLNRPESRNSINHPMRAAMVEAFTAANGSPESRAVVVTGGQEHFCGGGDLKGMGDRDIRSVHDRMRMAADVVRLIRRAPKPY